MIIIIVRKNAKYKTVKANANINLIILMNWIIFVLVNTYAYKIVSSVQNNVSKVYKISISLINVNK